jgi:hypothetical protein
VTITKRKIPGFKTHREFANVYDLKHNVVRMQMFRGYCMWPKKSKSNKLSTRKHPLYATWQNIKRRCYTKTDPDFKYYGARGIRMCSEWRISFDIFVKDVGHRPKGLSLDRINNDGNYEPGNCRWATPLQQLMNQRRFLNKKPNDKQKEGK